MEKDYEIQILIENFTSFKNKINNYKHPEELFGDLSGKLKDDKLESLKLKFRQLLKDYSADKYSRFNDNDLFNISSNISRKIIELEEIAEKQILNNKY